MRPNFMDIMDKENFDFDPSLEIFWCVNVFFFVVYGGKFRNEEIQCGGLGGD